MEEKLSNLEDVLIIMFQRYPVQQVLNRCGVFFGITAEEYVDFAFIDTGKEGVGRYSKEDLRNQFNYYCRMIHFENEKNMYCSLGNDESMLDPMECLFYYVSKALTKQDNEILCSYSRLISWRKLTLRVNEDLLVAAYLATKKTPEELTGKDLSWRLVLRNDNFQLRRIMERGLAENHFHLYGSAPIFHLSWISLMNQLTGTQISARLRDYEKKRMNIVQKADTTIRDIPLWQQHLLAATIRLYLFARIARMVEYINVDEGKREKILKRYGYEGYEEYLLTWLANLLEVSTNQDREMFELQNQLGNIQTTIDLFRDWDEVVLSDYALLECPSSYEEENVIFHGERWLMFQCLSRIRNKIFSTRDTNLFYTYILIKENIRNELLETDSRVGFSHFQDYDYRKFDLMDDSIFRGITGEYAKNAVRENILNSNIKSLEIRISPGMTVQDNLNIISNLDHIIGKQNNKYFYTFHFLKQQDYWKKKKLDPEAFYCRHDALRRRLRKQTNAIREFRERYPRIARRVLGIDAASQEIGCRPEVFATYFRFLHEHTAQIDYGSKIEYLPQLRKTYHVGEDFLDVTDGLRAIDEAVRFLDLKSGDRLGHALALGVNVEEWYTLKNYTISLSKQDYLDNIVWLYHMLLKYKLEGTEVLQEFLKREYSSCFQDLYRKNMSEDVIKEILKRFRCNKVGDNGSITYGYEQLDFNIFQYFRAWRLRGDDPLLYADGFYQPPEDDTDYDRCRIHLYNSRYPQERYVPEVFLLYYFYHYSKSIRAEGEQRYQTKVLPMYIEGVSKVQKALQMDVGKRGLAIETNPTSNIQIGITKSYSKHPILNFYNRELEVDSDLLEANPQLLVSINTDDQGIFCTSLENEYALLASSLENEKTEEGKYRYPKQRVYAWLDSIRKMGLDQTFGEPQKKSLQGIKKIRVK